MEKEKRTHFEIYKTASGSNSWRLRAGNGQIIATAHDTYKRRSDALRGIALVMDVDDTTKIEILDAPDEPREAERPEDA